MISNGNNNDLVQWKNKNQSQTNKLKRKRERDKEIDLNDDENTKKIKYDKLFIYYLYNTVLHGKICLEGKNKTLKNKIISIYSMYIKLLIHKHISELVNEWVRERERERERNQKFKMRNHT